MLRLKTGTPPRILSSSINYKVLEEQISDNRGRYLSFFTEQNKNKKIHCHITATNIKTHKLIHKNIQNSAMYSGKIDAQGVRYCPSIEDKVTKFKDRKSHNIFLEPEGLNSDLVYPNGISNSLDKRTQIKFLQTIKGLEKAKITEYGYAVEYDAIDPRQLTKELETKNFPNLYFLRDFLQKNYLQE